MGNYIFYTYVVIGVVVDGVVAYRAIKKEYQPDITDVLMFCVIGLVAGFLWPLGLVICLPYWSTKGLIRLWKHVANGLAEMKKPPLNAADGRIIEPRHLR